MVVQNNNIIGLAHPSGKSKCGGMQLPPTKRFHCQVEHNSASDPNCGWISSATPAVAANTTTTGHPKADPSSRTEPTRGPQEKYNQKPKVYMVHGKSHGRRRWRLTMRGGQKGRKRGMQTSANWLEGLHIPSRSWVQGIHCYIHTATSENHWFYKP